MGGLPLCCDVGFICCLLFSLNWLSGKQATLSTVSSADVCGCGSGTRSSALFLSAWLVLQNLYFYTSLINTATMLSKMNP